MMAIITENSKITWHFSLYKKALHKKTSGELIEIDSTFGRAEPVNFVMGDGNVLPGFENKLLGLKAGDEKEFVLLASEAFGESNPDSIHDMDKKQFKRFETAGELQEGLVVSFEGAGKRPMPGVVKSITGDKVKVDFNHPLADQEIIFKVHIFKVEKVTNNNIAVSQA